MLGIRFMKAGPTTYVILYNKGRVAKEGTGISFFYYAPTSSVVSISLAGADLPFIFEEVTADFQEITIQGQVTYRVQDPNRLAEILNFTLAPNNKEYASEDPDKLSQKILNQVNVFMKTAVQRIPLRTAIQAADKLVGEVSGALGTCDVVRQLGIEIIDLSILAIKPTPETARALEAETREKILMGADEAIYTRRNAAVEQERSIRENELNTEIAVENKKREIQEAKVEAQRSVQQKRQAIKEEEMQGRISIEKRNQDLVALATRNSKAEAEARAYGVTAFMHAFDAVDPKVMQALAMAGMNPSQLIAAAFQNLAENAGRIGNLNISPDLLQELMNSGSTA